MRRKNQQSSLNERQRGKSFPKEDQRGVRDRSCLSVNSFQKDDVGVKIIKGRYRTGRVCPWGRRRTKDDGVSPCQRE
jgi:hypothetical protein